MAMGSGAIGHEVQDPPQQQADRLTEVQYVSHLRVLKDRLRATGIAQHGRGVFVAFEDLQTLGHGHRVDVHVDHAWMRHDLLRHLVHAGLSRHAGPDVEELIDTNSSQVRHHATQGGAVGAYCQRHDVTCRGYDD